MLQLIIITDYPIRLIYSNGVTNYQIYNQQGGLGTVASHFFPIVNYIYPETALGTQAA